VNQSPPIISILVCIYPTAHARANHSAVHLWPIPILLRELHRRRRLSIPFPCPIHRQRPQQLSTGVNSPRTSLPADGKSPSRNSTPLRDAIDSRTSPLAFGIRQSQQPPGTYSRPNFTHACASSSGRSSSISTPRGEKPVLETFLSPSYLNTIQTSRPWVLRYLAASAILSRKAAAGVASAGATMALSFLVDTRSKKLSRLSKWKNASTTTP